MAGLDDTTRIRRLTGMLARKGYAPQVAFDVVRAELDS
jgi:regulatory protein